MTTALHNCIRPPGDPIARLGTARWHDPHGLLGRHAVDHQTVCCRSFLPRAREAWLLCGGADALHREPMTPSPDLPGLFTWTGALADCPLHPTILWSEGGGQTFQAVDPYSFPPHISGFDLHLFGEGRHWHAHRMMGAHPEVRDGIPGVRFAVWAPGAERVSVVGDFNHWDGRSHPMSVHGGSGVWELFIPGLPDGALYKFEIRNRESGQIFVKSDPYGAFFEMRPNTSSRVFASRGYEWSDDAWLQRRSAPNAWKHRPMSIYEVHLGSWKRGVAGRFLGYRELADELIPYVRDRGFTHIELLPVTEHPFDGSWGYQSTGFFAPTSRFGTPDDFRHLVDSAHRAGIGVLLDWVPGHFPKDAFALARFDGTALYEHEDPRKGEHRDWGTLIFNYGRSEVRNFLLSSALCWIEDFHIDGLRVDAVASMLYLDYSRQANDWIPNEYGGNENLDAIAFLRELNRTIQGNHPGVLMIAEESTAWPGVSRPPETGGLGFTMKWNMGWMHDTLAYFQLDPIHRRHHHNQLTFGMLYAYTENFVLPFSHDEVVHGKRTLRGRMPGDESQQHAQLRLLYAYQWTYPGKKLLFMGQEFGQGTEWSEDRELDWYILQYPLHQGMTTLVRDLNHLYRNEPTLHAAEFEPEGFAWLDCDDASRSVLSFLRRGGDSQMIVVLNLTPVPREDYAIPAPHGGLWTVRLNTDSEFYGGGSRGSLQARAEARPLRGFTHTLRLDLPPLAALILAPG
ncbi:1,4-alpha-glucan branching protein GlgB [Thioalkalivibrio nitratireducens]|uniref:1,4-alpha-glucan branching protein GlgB n=1 Tax=Thioalkalivibrio nitratireducens TaxID=186931 RepID=UPI0005C1D653|nr:1,4-alpha-glucan branching protein GlgB [Thioalkalivibrio nitratireducens]